MQRKAYQNNKVFRLALHADTKVSRVFQTGSLFNRLDNTFFGNEDTIQELTLVLSANTSALSDLSAAKGDSSSIDTLKDELIFNFSAGTDLAARLHNDFLDVATTQEVLDFNEGAVLGDVSVDREMSIDESHLVLAALK